MEPRPIPDVYRAISNITQALAKVGIAKKGKNEAQGYMFRGIEDVYGALSQQLPAHGLVILPRVIKREVIEKTTKNGGQMFYTALEVEFDFVATSDGSRHVVVTFGEAMDSGDKSTNKAMSAAYKYACIMTFAIPVEGEPDADSESPNLIPSNSGVLKGSNSTQLKEPVQTLQFPQAPTSYKKQLTDLVNAHNITQEEFKALTGLESIAKATEKACAEALGIIEAAVKGTKND